MAPSHTWAWAVAAWLGFRRPGSAPAAPPTQSLAGAGVAGSRGRGPSLTLEVDPRADPQHTREGGEVQGANEVLQRHRLHGPRGSLDADRVTAARALIPAAPPRPPRPRRADVGGVAPPTWAGPLRLGARRPRPCPLTASVSLALKWAAVPTSHLGGATSKV